MAYMPVHHRRSNAIVGRPRQRRKLVWATDFFSGVNVGAGAKLPQRDLLANLEVAGSSVLGATIMRTHFRFVAQGVLTDGPSLFHGFIVNTAPTVTNLDPSSSAAFGYDWMLLDTLSAGTALNSYSPTSTTLTFGTTIDLRSKRKIEELAEKYWYVLTNVTASAITVSGFTRTLVALP